MPRCPNGCSPVVDFASRINLYKTDNAAQSVMRYTKSVLDILRALVRSHLSRRFEHAHVDLDRRELEAPAMWQRYGGSTGPLHCMRALLNATVVLQHKPSHFADEPCRRGPPATDAKVDHQSQPAHLYAMELHITALQ